MVLVQFMLIKKCAEDLLFYASAFIDFFNLDLCLNWELLKIFKSGLWNTLINCHEYIEESIVITPNFIDRYFTYKQKLNILKHETNVYDMIFIWMTISY